MASLFHMEQNWAGEHSFTQKPMWDLVCEHGAVCGQSAYSILHPSWYSMSHGLDVQHALQMMAFAGALYSYFIFLGNGYIIAGCTNRTWISWLLRLWSDLQPKSDLWLIQNVSRLIFESLDSKKKTWNTFFANRIQTTFGGGLKCDSNRISTDASLSGRSDHWNRIFASHTTTTSNLEWQECWNSCCNLHCVKELTLIEKKSTRELTLIDSLLLLRGVEECWHGSMENNRYQNKWALWGRLLCRQSWKEPIVVTDAYIVTTATHADR